MTAHEVIQYRDREGKRIPGFRSTLVPTPGGFRLDCRAGAYAWTVQ